MSENSFIDSHDWYAVKLQAEMMNLRAELVSMTDQRDRARQERDDALCELSKVLAKYKVVTHASK